MWYVLMCGIFQGLHGTCHVVEYHQYHDLLSTLKQLDDIVNTALARITLD